MNSLAFVESIINEAQRSRTKFRKFASTHEAYAVIMEELEEYWECVKRNETNNTKYLEELVQVAAMCLCAAKELHQ